MNPPKTIALFPEASFGAALNCVGIAQELRRMGAQPVFICHPGFRDVFAEYGFAEVHLADPASNGPIDWTDFIERYKDAFRQSAFDQLESYVGPTWDAIVDTAMRVEEPLRQVLARLKPDVIVLDNVVSFPAIANAGVPWVRVVSCAETEIFDTNVPPYLSGCSALDRGEWAEFSARYAKVTAAAHKRFASFMADCGLKAPAAPVFLDPSPFLNLLLAPDIIRHMRDETLDSRQFIFLNGCVRKEASFDVPRFARNNDDPLVLASFGSLGAIDVDLIQRMLSVFADLPYRFLVNVGQWRDAYRDVPDNVFIDSWFPQPSVVEQASLFIHHGGNNSFCEALFYGAPSLVMPYCWDGHDNARRAVEAGVGDRLNRYDWQPQELAEKIRLLLGDHDMHARLAANSKLMRAAKGASAAAESILALTKSPQSV